MTTLFVTATGTDVGKTFIVTGLVGHYRAANRQVDAIKPVVSGFDPAAPEASDPALLIRALGREPTPAELERISPWRFAAPLSPDQAAQREGRSIDFQELVTFCRRAVAVHRGVLLIEGIGGVMVPLDAHHTVLDLMSLLRSPAMLVSGSYVGTISHTLTALEVLARRNVEIAAIVVSESPASAASLDETVAAIAHFADVIPVIGLPRPAGAEHPAFARIAALL